MFKKWKEKLKRLAGRAGTFFNRVVEKWSEAGRYRLEREYPQLGFQELTPLEEARIRTGYWNPRW